MLNPVESIMTTSLSRANGTSMIPVESWNMGTTGPNEPKTDYIKVKLKFTLEQAVKFKKERRGRAILCL